MNRIRTGWQALGRARQGVVVLVVALSVIQVAALVLAGMTWAIPIVLLVVVLCGMQIKISAATRDATLFARRTLRLAKDANSVGRRQHRELVGQIRDVDRFVREVDKSKKPANEELGVLREQIGRTVGQFTWLGEQLLETKAIASSVHHAMNESSADIRAHQGRLMELDERIAVGAEKLSGEVSAVQDALVADVAAIASTLNKTFDAGNSHSLERRLIAELSALAQLGQPIDTPDLPTIGGWAMSPVTLHLVRHLACKLTSDQIVVELGSGVSTAWTAHALAQKNNPARYIAIDHHPGYAAVTREHISDLRLSSTVDVVVAPLQSVIIDGEPFNWYGTDWIATVRNIGLLIVDGPPAGKDEMARYPALPLLVDRLADEATIVLDDVERPGESETVAKWLRIPGVTSVQTVGRSLVLSFSRPGRKDK